MQVVIADGENVTESTRSLGGSVSSTRIYLRGMYRMLDRRLSPIASCDVGMRFYSYEEDMHGMDVINSFGNIGMEEILGSPENSGLFLSPPIGISLRTTNNSYVELKGGYTMAPNILGQKASTEKYGRQVYGSCKSVKTSTPFVSIGFTHTFGKRGEKR